MDDARQRRTQEVTGDGPTVRHAAHPLDWPPPAALDPAPFQPASKASEHPAAIDSMSSGIGFPRRRMVEIPVLAAVVLLVGMTAITRPAESDGWSLEERVTAMELAVEARDGELTLLELELERMETVAEHSSRYDIPMDLAAAIHDIALEEGIEPEVAYDLVRVESGFYDRAISSKGAVGLAQVMPTTAYWLDPTLQYSDLFQTDTNLRLGFRYLRSMLDRYGGDLRLALLAYNRGPGTVDSLRGTGRDPSNGYARAVLRR